MTKAPQTLAEALEVIRSMHNDLLAFRNPEFDLITPGREGEFDDRVKAVLAHSAPVFSMTTNDQTIQAKADAAPVPRSDDRYQPVVAPAPAGCRDHALRREIGELWHP